MERYQCKKMDLLLRIAKVVDMNAQEWTFTRILWQLETIDIDGDHLPICH